MKNRQAEASGQPDLATRLPVGIVFKTKIFSL